MNAGLSNLIWLKKRLLLASDVSGSTCDDAVAAVGLGVAGMFEDEMDRKLGRVAGDAYEAPGDRTYYVLPRYPVETVTAVQVRDYLGESWASYSLNYNLLPVSGLVTFVSWPASRGGSVKITFTGGFWWDTTEDNTGTQPSGSTIVPEGLRNAWAMACKTLWDRSGLENAAKAGFGSEEAGRILAEGFEWPKNVRETIQRYRRMA